jgi:hypothetical protein
VNAALSELPALLAPSLDVVRRSVAHSAGVDFACSGADFLSASHRNMERAGMRLQFTRAI